jgi:hypothetical protein
MLKLSACLSSNWVIGIVMEGSSLFDSRSYCEPTQSAWGSISGRPRAVKLVDTHLLSKVLRPSGNGKLGPFFLPFSATDWGRP